MRKHKTMKLLKLIKSYLRDWLIILEIYQSKTGRFMVSKVANWWRKPWVYILYVSDYKLIVDKNSHGGLSACTHQNQREIDVIVRSYNRLGYNVYVNNWNKKPYFPHVNVRIVMGVEPYFEHVCSKYRSAKKIYYATTSYYVHQNNQIIIMTDYANRRYGIDIPYERIIQPHKGVEIADDVLCIGSKYSIQTYPEVYQCKMKLIHQSSLVDNKKEILLGNKKHYFFMASVGNMLRGIPLLIEYFAANPDKTLHWVGELDDDFMNNYKDIVPSNIHFYGWVYADSHKMQEIVSHANFILYPSGSEGGCPGSVINGMKYGLIPIVTQWAASDEMDKYGYVMKEWSVDAISEAINEAESLSKEEILQKKHAVAEYAHEMFSIQRFEIEFRNFLTDVGIYEVS